MSKSRKGAKRNRIQTSHESAKEKKNLPLVQFFNLFTTNCIFFYYHCYYYFSIYIVLNIYFSV